MGAELNPSENSPPAGAEKSATTGGEKPAESPASGEENAAAGQAKAFPALAARPTNVIDLLTDPTVASDPDWFTENSKRKRFFVIGVDDVLAAIGVSANNSSPYFEKAEAEIIPQQTTWQTQYNFKYECSNVQLREKALHTSRTFGKSATLILALELAAADKKPDYNVYAHLRILPAHYFVDRFDIERLEKLRAAHKKFTEEELAQKFPEGPRATFDEACAGAIGQWVKPNPLQEMGLGHCATHVVCERLIKFVKDFYPADLHVGPTRLSGDDARSDPKLGTKDATDRLKVPKSLSRLVPSSG